MDEAACGARKRVVGPALAGELVTCGSRGAEHDMRHGIFKWKVWLPSFAPHLQLPSLLKTLEGRKADMTLVGSAGLPQVCACVDAHARARATNAQCKEGAQGTACARKRPHTGTARCALPPSTPCWLPLCGRIVAAREEAHWPQMQACCIALWQGRQATPHMLPQRVACTHSSRAASV